ncbi:CHAP domain-containing protein [Alloscardovia theropitheci]|uniref:CHAP domain-containing protein n=1 Tax=Alloscardovia theropitheci TaxID=2496842 RepID=A0A4R0QX06_9BIFI|nr:CHAP domain-containing protein [Alloscardovia theropitheci]TCD54070.1 CHAP domain-containing protein [Alloscardovia theropitheci]
MKHAAHKAASVNKRTAKHASALTSTLATETLHEAVAREVNAMPRTRRERRAYERAHARKNRFTMSGAITLLLGTVGTAVAATAAGMNSNLFDRTVAVAAAADTHATTTDSTARSTVSRSSERTSKDEIQPGVETASVKTSDAVAWNVEDGATAIDVNNLTAIDHPTGDVGLAYEFSQCTWWAYTRRHQLGLPVGSYFGNGAQWANSARKLGYSVDNKPQVGDVVVFQPGQEGAVAYYGHVAIVEKVNDDGSIVTSESNAGTGGKIFSRTISNASRFEFIHE